MIGRNLNSHVDVALLEPRWTDRSAFRIYPAAVRLPRCR